MSTKTCTKCKETKPIDSYSKDKKTKDGYDVCCKSCKREYKLLHKDRDKKQGLLYREQNRLKLNKQSKEYYSNNKDHVKSYQKKYELVNKETRKNQHKINYQENKENRIKTQIEYQKVKRLIDVNFKILGNCRNRVYLALKNNQKSGHTLDLIGCDIITLKLHLEKQFKVGMTWNNHGLYGWHIDHIIPCAAFNLSDPEQQRKCFNYTNLQPLWAEENLVKSDNLI